MISSILNFLIRTPHFPGKARLARIVGTLSGPKWVRSNYGPLFKFFPEDATSSYAVIGGGYDDVLEQLYRLEPGMNFVDIGANAGLMSLIASAYIGPDDCCFAFEPNPIVAARMIENIWKNRASNIQLLPIAISDQTNVLSLSFNPKHTGAAHLVKSGQYDLTVLAVHLEQTLPRLVSDICAKPFFVKVDVEGHEVHVLRSISILLANIHCRSVILEIEHDFLDRAGSSAADVFSIMKSHGFAPTVASAECDHYNEIFVRTETE